MNYLIITTCGLLLAVAVSLPLVAQTKNKKQATPALKTRNNKAKPALTSEQQTALYMLDLLLDSSKSFSDERLKIKTQSQIADVLWRYDEPRARRQFEETFIAISSIDISKQPTADPLAFAISSPIFQLQSDVLGLIAHHDSAMAERLIKSIKEDSSNKDITGKPQDNQSSLFLETATTVAATNPDRAVELAKAGVSSSINPAIVNVLFTLRKKNPAQADVLYRAALAVARQNPETASLNIMTLAPYALPGFMTLGLVELDVSQSNTAIVAEFLDFAFVTFVRKANSRQTGSQNRFNPMDYMTGQRLLPFFSQYMPDKAPMFRSAVEILARGIPQNVESSIGKMFQPGSSDDMAKQADDVQDTLQRDLLYFRSATMASAGGDFDKALTIVERISDKEFRAGVDSLLRSQAASASIKKDDVDLALRYTKNIVDVRQRALLYAKVARLLLSKKEVARAMQVLTDAEVMVGKSDEGIEKAQAMLVITEVKARFDPIQGFENMEATVKAFNQANLSTKDKDKTPAPVGASMLSGVINTLLKIEESDLKPSFSLLANYDFNRAVQLAKALKKEDMSVVAQLAVCRAVLSPKS